MAMQPNEQTLKAMAQQLEATMSHVATARKQATDFLKQSEAQPGFAVVLLSSISNNSFPIPIRLAGAIYFKNYTMHNWVPDTEVDIIQANDRATIKKHLVQLMLTSPKKIQAQLSQAMGIISNEDFPGKWKNLLPELVEKMGSSDFGVLCGVLETAQSIFYRYRHEMKSQRLWEEIAYVLKDFQKPITELFKRVCGLIKQNETNKQALDQLFDVLLLIIQIFISLNSQDIPQYFEENMKTWFAPFLSFLSYKNNLLEPKSNDEPGRLDTVQAAICTSVKLYTEKYEEQFKEWVPQFVNSSWSLLTTLSEAERYDELVTTAIKLLTSVVKKAWYKGLFSDEQALRTICEKIVIPQLKLREADVDVFKMNGLEYIRRDMEGSDIDTRRRTTVDFVRGLCTHFEAQITSILKGYVASLLQEYSSNPAKNWVQKDVAMYIVLALTVRGETRAKGATQTNQYIDIIDFFKAQVLPELQSKTPTAPVLTADCLKFVATFRHQLPPDAFPALIPVLMQHLASDEFVIHTYAASGIDKLLSVKNEKGDLMFGKEKLTPVCQTLLLSLFKVLEHEESNENAYVMKSIMRVCGVGQETMAPFVSVILQRVTHILSQVAKNPRNPQFNHYLFEIIACLCHFICRVKPEARASFTAALFPPFQAMLGMESCVEFMPYEFQILALLLEGTKETSPAYVSLYPCLLSPALWDNPGNVPAMTRLLQAYLVQGAKVCTEANRFEGLLGIFQKLNASKKLDHYGLDLLGTIVMYLPPSVFAPFLTEMLNQLFNRLMKRKTPKFVRCFIVWMALFVGKHGCGALLKAMDSVQDKIFDMVLEKVWIPNTTTITDAKEKKIVAVGMTAMLCRSSGMLKPPYINRWPKLLESLIAMLEGAPAKGTGAETEEPEDAVEMADQGFKTAYCKLHFAPLVERDCFADVKDTKLSLATSLATLTTQHPGKLSGAISHMPQEHQQALKKYLSDAKVGLS